MSLRVGIFTFHAARNFGAQLQAFSLKKYVESLGYSVNLVDYNPPYIPIEKEYSLKAIWTGKHGLLKKIFSSLGFFAGGYFINRGKRKRRKNFTDFAKQLTAGTPEYHKEMDLDKTYDVLLFGSDQIWNPDITAGKFDAIFWGDVSGFHGYKASYAASCGKNDFSPILLEEIRGLLRNLDSISVREDNIRELFQSLTEKHLTTVCDPVFLLSRETWYQMTPTESQFRGKYILVYELLKDKQLRQIANYLAKKNGCRVVECKASLKFQEYFCPSKQLIDSPMEFLKLFKNADFVVTNSFHGTVFSIVFRRNFYTVEGDLLKRSERNGRLRNLLKQFGLEMRLIQSTERPEVKAVDYSTAEKSLEIYRKASFSYLADVFAAAEKRKNDA